jgi:hypothetical protein
VLRSSAGSRQECLLLLLDGLHQFRIEVACLRRDTLVHDLRDLLLDHIVLEYLGILLPGQIAILIV